MTATSWRSRLRAAVYQGDGAAVIALAHLTPEARLDGDDAPVWQLLGDGLIIALTDHVDGAPAVATGCAAALRERDWAGDTELAEQLDALLGTGPTPLLRPLPVDLDQLAELLEGDPTHSGGLIDLSGGEVWPHAVLDDPDEPSDDIHGTGRPDPDNPHRWLWVQGHGSRAGYHDMDMFIATLTDPDQAERLRDAITGRGAFRRFRDVLARWPEPLQRWFAFSEERHRGRARAWLATAGYRSTRRPPT